MLRSRQGMYCISWQQGVSCGPERVEARRREQGRWIGGGDVERAALWAIVLGHRELVMSRR